MKLIVQIPCLNEEQTLAETVADIPRKIDGIDEVCVMVIDDGSTDRTHEVARACGVDYIVHHTKNRGLARTFRTGLEASLKLGADIIVNTDADNQYNGADIPKLVKPIVEGKANMVIGDRQTDKIQHFSFLKKRLQNLGSYVVRKLSETDVADAVSGFRAIDRDLALQLNIVTSFSYTIETVIQTGKKHYAVMSVPIGTNPQTRPSRLFKSIPNFIERSLSTMVRTYVMYQPLRAFFYAGMVTLIIGMLPVLRFVYYYLIGEGGGKLQSLVLGGSLIVLGGIILLVGVIADLINFNRQLLEMTLVRVRRIEFATGAADYPEVETVERTPDAGETTFEDLTQKTEQS